MRKHLFTRIKRGKRYEQRKAGRNSMLPVCDYIFFFHNSILRKSINHASSFVVCIIIYLSSVVTGFAQDLHLSQYQYAPMHTSPALTGFAVDGMLFSVQYRSQWAPLLGDNSFSTTSANFEYRALSKSLDFWGYGVALWNDQAGALTHTQGQLNIAYSKQLAGTGDLQHILSAGFDIGVMQRTIDITDRKWLSQYNGNGGFDPNLPGSTLDIFNRTVPDLGLGMAWHTTFKNNSFVALSGAVQHLYKPDLSYNKNAIFGNMYSRYVLFFESEVALSERTRWISSVIIQKQGPSMEILPRTGLKTIVVNDAFNHVAFQMGGALRIVNRLEAGQTLDAFIALLRMDWNKFSFGFSYDINLSTLSQSVNNNSLEMVIAYRVPRLKQTSKLLMITPRYF